ncbi:autorepressor SdpR family transcription factor [Maricaulis sp.]|uniref:autorepressor SdpR family transcription factor n=1 Tax=Maricaulis sp. TaxID=1486257 RepID=UPI003A8D9412
MSDVFKALADPTRRKVLQILKSGPQTAGELSDAFPVSKPTMSAHFNVLKQAGLVVTEKAGKSVIYHLNVSVLEEALLGFSEAFGFGRAATDTNRETPQ